MEYNKGKIIFISIMLVLLLIVVVAGGTYAYFMISANINNNNIGGGTYKFDVSLQVTIEKASSNLVPFSDARIVDAISKTNKCIDKDGYEICSMYKLSLTNNGSSDEVLYGYVTTDSTTYVSDRLKYQIFSLNDGTYAAVTDALSVALNSDKVYFKKNNVQVNTSLTKNTSQDYYLVMWISLIENAQNEDAGKSFSGYVNFDSIYGNRLSAQFSS